MTKKLSIILFLFLSLFQYSFADTVLRIGKVDDGVKIYVNGQYIQTGTGKKVDLILKNGDNKVEFSKEIDKVFKRYLKIEYKNIENNEPIRIESIKLMKSFTDEYKELIKTTPKNFIFVEGVDQVEGGPWRPLFYSDSFYISKYEVTQKEYRELMDYNPSKFKGDNNPVEQVTWYDAIMYANKLSEKEGFDPYYNIEKIFKVGNNIVSAKINVNEWSKGYRLPKWIEWNYAAKGGNLSKNYEYSGSDKIDKVAWYNKNSKNSTQIVGRKEANELGLYDMTGNVAEWIWDWDKDRSISSDNNTEEGTIIKVQGGAWAFSELDSQFYKSLKVYAKDYHALIGFRLVRSTDKDNNVIQNNSDDAFLENNLEFKNNLFYKKNVSFPFTGKEIYVWLNDDKYEGDFLNGLATGKGIFIWPNGDKYEGDFLNGLATGKGIFIWPNGDKYEGDFLNGHRTGKGIFIWSNGDKYEGDFLDGSVTGKGTLVKPNGNKYEGTWKDNKYIGK